ncbi:hypothetical protein GBA52_011630 [Prunus armeniaca]|nr:hypothetical protein GBA52_011630 [Prunus armeniaca]
MNHLNRVWMAASVAVVQGPCRPGPKWTSGLKSFQLKQEEMLGWCRGRFGSPPIVRRGRVGFLPSL